MNLDATYNVVPPAGSNVTYDVIIDGQLFARFLDDDADPMGFHVGFAAMPLEGYNYTVVARAGSETVVGGLVGVQGSCVLVPPSPPVTGGGGLDANHTTDHNTTVGPPLA
jgi:hypothetical protein